LKAYPGFSTQQLPPGHIFEHFAVVSLMRQHFVPEVMQHLFDMQFSVVAAQLCILGSLSIISFSTTRSIAALCGMVLWLP
jgi:hypothetical protein